MNGITKKLEQAGIIMESKRLSQESLSAKDRAFILEARMAATKAGWDRSLVEWMIDEGRGKARAHFQHQHL